MVGAKVDFVGERELRGGAAELICRGGLLEDLVAARVFEFKGKFVVGFSFVVSLAERERTDVDGLARLVDGLFRSEEDGGFVLEVDGLRKFGGTDRSFGDVA